MKRLLLSAAILFSLIVPTALADTLIVGNKREHTISFIDLTSGDEVRRVETGKAPHEVAVSPDGTIAAVVSYRDAGYTGNTVHVFDVASGEKLRVIDLGEHNAPHGLKWIAGTSRVAVTTENSQHLVIADVEAGEVVIAIPTDAPGSHMLALSPDMKIAYVANIQGGSFSVLDLETGECKKIVKAGEGTEAISVSPDGQEIWVGNNNSRNVMIFNARNYKRKSTLKTDGIPIRVEISPDGQYVAVSEANLNLVTIFDADTRTEISTIDLAPAGGKIPVTMLWHPDGSKLWVATTQAARVIEINTADWSVSRALIAGEGSDGLGYTAVDAVTE